MSKIILAALSCIMVFSQIGCATTKQDSAAEVNEAPAACAIATVYSRDNPGEEFPKNYYEQPYQWISTTLGKEVPGYVVPSAQIFRSIDPAYLRICAQTKGGGATIWGGNGNLSYSSLLRPGTCTDINFSWVALENACVGNCDLLAVYLKNSCHHPPTPYVAHRFDQSVNTVIENDLSNLKSKKVIFRSGTKIPEHHLYNGESARQVEFCTTGNFVPRGFTLYSKRDRQSAPQRMEITSTCTYATGVEVWVTSDDTNADWGYFGHRLVK